MIPLGIIHSKVQADPIWYIDLRPTNASKSLTAPTDWHILTVPVLNYSVVSGFYALANEVTNDYYLITDLAPTRGTGSERLDFGLVCITNKENVFGYMFDDPSYPAFDKMTARAVTLGAGHYFTVAGTTGQYSLRYNMTIASYPLPSPSPGGFYIQKYKSGSPVGTAELIYFSDLRENNLSTESLGDTAWSDPFTMDIEASDEEYRLTPVGGDYISGAGSIAIQKL